MPTSPHTGSKPSETPRRISALQETIARRPVADEADQPGMTREQCENLKTLRYVGADTDCSKLP